MSTIKITPGQWAWDRPCEWCGAGVRQPCMTRAGKITTTHAARTDRRTAR